jgi:hypothetical protein
VGPLRGALGEREREAILTISGSGEVQQMKAVAIKKGQGQEKGAGLQEMGTLRCDGCGEEFFIGHHPAFVDKWLADRQAHWLEKVLAEEHERDKKHPDCIELPD